MPERSQVGPNRSPGTPTHKLNTLLPGTASRKGNQGVPMEGRKAHGAELGIFTDIQGATYLVRAPQDLRSEPGVSAAAGAAAGETGTRDSFLQKEERVEPGVQRLRLQATEFLRAPLGSDSRLMILGVDGCAMPTAGSSAATPALPQHWRVPSHPSHGSTPTPPSSCHLRPADRRLPLLQP